VTITGAHTLERRKQVLVEETNLSPVRIHRGGSGEDEPLATDDVELYSQRIEIRGRHSVVLAHAQAPPGVS